MQWTHVFRIMFSRSSLTYSWFLLLCMVAVSVDATVIYGIVAMFGRKCGCHDNGLMNESIVYYCSNQAFMWCFVAMYDCKCVWHGNAHL